MTKCDVKQMVAMKTKPQPVVLEGKLGRLSSVNKIKHQFVKQSFFNYILCF